MQILNHMYCSILVIDTCEACSENSDKISFPPKHTRMLTQINFFFAFILKTHQDVGSKTVANVSSLRLFLSLKLMSCSVREK